MRETTAIQRLECDHRFEWREHLADLVEVDLAVRLDGEACPLDGRERPASRVCVEVASPLQRRQDRPHDPCRLGAPLPRDARHQLPAVQHAQPLDRAQLSGAFDEGGDLGMIRSIRRGRARGGRCRGPAARRPGDLVDGVVDRCAHALTGRYRLDLAQRRQWNHRFKGRPQLADLRGGELTDGAQDPAAVHSRAHRRPSLVSGQQLGDQGQRRERDRLLAFGLPVLGHGLEQRARCTGFDPPPPGQGRQLLSGQRLQGIDEAERPGVEHV